MCQFVHFRDKFFETKLKLNYNIHNQALLGLLNYARLVNWSKKASARLRKGLWVRKAPLRDWFCYHWLFYPLVLGPLASSWTGHWDSRCKSHLKPSSPGREDTSLRSCRKWTRSTWGHSCRARDSHPWQRLAWSQSYSPVELCFEVRRLANQWGVVPTTKILWSI